MVHYHVQGIYSSDMHSRFARCIVVFLMIRLLRFAPRELNKQVACPCVCVELFQNPYIHHI